MTTNTMTLKELEDKKLELEQEADILIAQIMIIEEEIIKLKG